MAQLFMYVLKIIKMKITSIVIMLSLTTICLCQPSKYIWKNCQNSSSYEEIIYEPNSPNLWVVTSETDRFTIFLYDTSGVLIDQFNSNVCGYGIFRSFSICLSNTTGIIVAKNINCGSVIGKYEIAHYNNTNSKIQQKWKNTIDISSIINQSIKDMPFVNCKIVSSKNEYIMINIFSTKINYLNTLIGFIRNDGAYYKNTWFKDVEFSILSHFTLPQFGGGLVGSYKNTYDEHFLGIFKFNSGNILEQTWSKELSLFYTNEQASNYLSDCEIDNFGSLFISSAFYDSFGKLKGRINKFNINPPVFGGSWTISLAPDYEFKTIIWNPIYFHSLQLTDKYLYVENNRFLYKYNLNRGDKVMNWEVNFKFNESYFIDKFENIYGSKRNKSTDIEVQDIDFSDCVVDDNGDREWLYKLGYPTNGVITHEPNNNNIKLTPNLAYDNITLMSENKGIVLYKIFDLSGNFILENCNLGNTKQIDIDVSLFTPGLYIIIGIMENDSIFKNTFIKI